jgi:GNAT superfamily N-acetyltransferase
VSAPPAVEFREVALDHPDVVDLAKAMGDEVDRIYAHLDLPPIPSLASFLAAGDVAIVGYIGEVAATVGAVRRIDATTGEIKRMFVVPGERGRGISRQLLAKLEDVARGLGFRRILLDTGARQPRALALYRATGYREIPDYNGNPFASYWFEKEI